MSSKSPSPPRGRYVQVHPQGVIVTPQVFGQLRQIIGRRAAIARMGSAEATVLGFEDVVGVGKAVLCQQGSKRTGARRLPGEEPLAHTTVMSEHQAGGLLSGMT